MKGTRRIPESEPAPESEPEMQTILRQDLHDLQDKVCTLDPEHPVNPVDPVQIPGPQMLLQIGSNFQDRQDKSGV